MTPEMQAFICDRLQHDFEELKARIEQIEARVGITMPLPVFTPVSALPSRAHQEQASAPNLGAHPEQASVPKLGTQPTETELDLSAGLTISGLSRPATKGF